MYKYFFRGGILALVLSISGCASNQAALEVSWEELEDSSQSLTEKYIESETSEAVQVFGETEEEKKTIGDTSDMIQVTVDINGRYEREYYQSLETFLSVYGIENQKPDFVYDNIDGRRQLELYFNEDLGIWCGIRDFYNHDADLFASSKPYGFIFEEQEPREWDASELNDISIDGCRIFCQHVKEYQESFTYDEEGRVTRFQISGINNAVPEEGVQLLLQTDYTYREDGTLLHRKYAHNSMAFGTWQCRRDTYFDDLGRVTYEDVYITHGNMDYYFFYKDNELNPYVCLVLDYNTGDWYAEWAK